MIWVDMDGVAADFDAHHEALFGYKPTRWPQKDTANWDGIRNTPHFYATMPMMPDALELLDGIRPRPFKMLTGVPQSVDTASNDKVDWVRAKIASQPETICCRSRDKYLFCRPGDVLIDDYLKYRDRWIDAGGIFIHHTSARSSLQQLLTIESA